MQAISINDLKKLLPAASEAEVDEAFEAYSDIGRGLTFRKVEHQYQDIAKSKHGSLAAACNELVHKVLPAYQPPIELVGEGSSRIAFACIGGKCLKVAKSPAGAAQNRQEHKTASAKLFRKRPDCFIASYEIEPHYGGLLLTECCTPFKDDAQLLRELGVETMQVLTAALWAVTNNLSQDTRATAASLLSDCSEWRQGRGKTLNGSKPDAKAIESAEKAAYWLKNDFARGKTLAQRTLQGIVKFWQDYGTDELLPGDVCIGENWGYAIRKGRIWPVMVDVGFSGSVADKHYRT